MKNEYRQDAAQRSYDAIQEYKWIQGWQYAQRECKGFQPEKPRKSTPLIALLCIALLFTYTAFAEYEQDDDITCMALNIYHEARGETLDGMLAVAQVTLNRVNHRAYPNTVREVVYQPKQFSWTHQGKATSSWEIFESKHDLDRWTHAVDIAHAVLAGTMKSKIGTGVLHYHTTSVNPSWGKVMVISEKIGNHVFLSKL